MITIKQPWRLGLTIIGGAICAGVGGWPVWLAFMAGTVIWSFGFE